MEGWSKKEIGLMDYSVVIVGGVCIRGLNGTGKKYNEKIKSKTNGL